MSRAPKLQPVPPEPTGPQPEYTRIGVTPEDLEREAQQPARAPEMLIQTANALVTGAPISEEQLRLAMAHYRALAALLLVSGPAFQNAARDATNRHNVAVRRVRESRDEALVRARRHEELTEGLVELAIDI